MPADRAMSRNLKSSGKGSNSRIQVSGQSLPHNPQHSTSDSLKQQRKKRNQIADQVPQSQQPRQSVFERLGTKNSGTAPIPRSAKTRKETKDHSSGKTRRFSESRQAERELSDGELTQDIGKIKDRQPVEVRSKADGGFNKSSSEYKTDDNTK
ncbi:9539_t:CDS:2, partial [Acaulospora colombiana]